MDAVDLVKAVEEGIVEDPKAVVEPVVEPTPDPVPVEPTMEEQARTKGWRPEDEYEGVTPWVDAKEFVGRQPLFDALHKSNKKIKDLEATVDNLVDHNKKIRETERKEALKDLKKQKVEAMENGDNATVVELDDQIDDVKREREEEVAPANSAAYTEFLENNSWYGTDAGLKKAATDMGYGYQFANPQASEQEVFEFVEKQIKLQNPDKFDPPRRKARQSVATPRNTSAAAVKAGDTLQMSDLSHEERKVVQNILRNSTMSEEDYLKQLAKTR